MTKQTSYAGDGEYVESYYAYSANPAPDRPHLEGDAETEVCVVGAGYTGLSAAITLAEKGYQVCVLEGAKVGWGASGRNGGQIVNGLNASLQSFRKRYGTATAKFVASVVQEGGEIIRDRVKRYEIACDLKDDNIFAALNGRHMQDLEERVTVWESYGLHHQELLSKDQMRELVGSDLYVGGVIDRSGGHMHPLNLALGEADALESLGGVIHERTPALRIDHSGDRPVVETPHGRMTCDTLVLCGNAYLGSVVPTLSWRVMPVSTQIMATKPLGDELARELLPSDACVEDVRYILDYYRLSADKRLLFGGGTVYGGSTPSDIKAKLMGNMTDVFPALKDVAIDFAWSGNFALSFTRVPQLGRLGDSTYFAQGYSGHGVVGSHLFGRILGEAIDGDRSRFDVFAKMPWVPFPGGRLFRVPYSTVGSWWYALRDRLGI
ncbi:Gamma-glutamylputrescine oxidoreductase [Methyloligella halotolerans]|uniref:Gamma-glutamylputrescine oxidoreductase n=1 Tax=Methyloligella halotolerans TaxID=1177755 RepID=A0A1E2RX01_9HYPH|nr:FAD-binding oxidoreductase [Methyloligella halotolerans]ODA66743.1 Gamma-glutamylputrescine oxidoreductase [Methyloligella halotolerans]